MLVTRDGFTSADFFMKKNLLQLLEILMATTTKEMTVN
jgi:hypothetical protein